MFVVRRPLSVGVSDVFCFLQANPQLDHNGQLTTNNGQTYINNMAPVTIMLMSARGISTFQPSAIS